MNDPDLSVPPAHEGWIELGPGRNVGAPDGTGLPHVRFVRYPGCQQLQLWLPQPGRTGYGEWRVVSAAGSVIERAPVERTLSGSIQLLFDTLAWPPGEMTLVIEHEQGWRHEVPMHKLEADEDPPEEPAPVVEPPRDEPIVYRDGFGRLLPNLDLELRAQVLERTMARITRRVVYQDQGRSGCFVYLEGDLNIRFSEEMGARPCRSVVDIPSPSRWELATGTPLARRDEIVQFVAAAATREVGGSRFVIDENSIAIY